MELEAIGRVEHPEELELEPITIPIVGYTREKEEVIQPVNFRPVQPTGAALDVLRMTNVKGDVPVAPVMRFLDECVVEEDRKSWDDFLNDPTVYIEQDTLIQLYRVLTEVYSSRPTAQRSVSHNGRVTSRTTSRAAASKKVSTSTRSRSTKAST
jgi:hypothetical protein